MKTILASAALLLPLAAFPQTLVEETVTYGPTEVRVIEFQDSARHYYTLHENAPHLINLPDVPRFALFGKEGKFYMGIGANVKTTVGEDLGHPVSDPNYFVTANIPMQIAPGNGGQFKVSAQQSNVYLNVVALPGSKDQLGAYVSVTFLGNNYAPKLQHAYLKWRGITAGYTYSIFADAASTPATIDYEGPNACATIIHGMVAYEPYLDKEHNWRAGIALDIPEASYTNATNTSTVNQRVPDIPMYIQRNWAGGEGWFRLAGIVRNIQYRDNIDQKNFNKLGWGIKGSGKTPIAGGLSAAYMALYGRGIASYIQDINGCGLDLMPDPEDPYRLEAVKAWSGFASLQYRFNPRCFMSATYSHVRTYAKQFTDSQSDWKTGYKYAQYIAGNVFYNVNSIVQVGAEYLYGRRVDYNGMQAHDNRIQAMLKVSF